MPSEVKLQDPRQTVRSGSGNFYRYSSKNVTVSVNDTFFFGLR